MIIKSITFDYLSICSLSYSYTNELLLFVFVILDRLICFLGDIMKELIFLKSDSLEEVDYYKLLGECYSHWS